MSRLEETIELFSSVDPKMRLELLLEYAGRLPALPEEYVPLRDAGLNLVHECQSPVFLVTDVRDGAVHIVADVPREAPTARGFTSLLIDVFEGERPEDVRNAPADILHRLGIAGLIGMQRTHGLSGIYARIRREVERKTAESA